MDDEKSQVYKALGLLGSLGLIATACVFGGVLGGYYLDRWLGTQSVFTLVGTVLGVASLFVVTYKWIMRHIR